MNSFKNNADRAIYKALGIQLPNDEAKKMIADADELALAVESRLFISEPDIEWRPEIGVHDDIACMVENLAYKVFELSQNECNGIVLDELNKSQEAIPA